MNSTPWYERCRRRLLVDMHIPDWDESFLSELSPERYIEMMLRAGASSAMVYANSHVGLCNWPTKTGAMHRGLKGVDFFGRMLELCRRHELGFVAYYSLIYNNWAYIHNPDWRIVPVNGPISDRYGRCCPNSPGYREFALAQIEELFSSYECDGVFFDMTFWLHVCCCHNCVSRYREETGGDPPRAVDWSSPEWIAFQRWREGCIDEFARITTAKVRQVRPQMTVTHQFATILNGWKLGVPFSLSDHCDYLSGDFYGPATQQSIVCKAFESLSKKHPFEFHTSRCMDLWDHVTLKSPQRMQTQAFLAPAHSSAFMFIDAIDPVGTLHEPVYDIIKPVFAEMAPYEPFAGGRICADVGLYFSEESKFDPDDDSADPAESEAMPHWPALQGACKALQEAHLPFGIVTRRNLSQLESYQVLVLPDVLLMDEEEAEAVRRFVRDGGSLYASGRSSSRLQSGEWPPDFLLADVFGASRTEERRERYSYISAASKRCKALFAPQEHMIHRGVVQRVSASSAEVAATLTLPYTDPTAGNVLNGNFASIHSNPPGPMGSEPALLFNSFEHGRACYAACSLEATDHDINRRVFAQIIRELLPRPAWFGADAHPCVEVVLYDQSDRQRMLISLLNFQERPPSIPVDGSYRVRPPAGTHPQRLLRLPEQTDVAFELTGDGYASFDVKGLEVFAQFLLEYE